MDKETEIAPPATFITQSRACSVEIEVTSPEGASIRVRVEGEVIDQVADVARNEFSVLDRNSTERNRT